jgi:hypothetical protein
VGGLTVVVAVGFCFPGRFTVLGVVASVFGVLLFGCFTVVAGAATVLFVDVSFG